MDYERLWLTTSLRGMLHLHRSRWQLLGDGPAPGLGQRRGRFVVPRRRGTALERIENGETGEIKLTESSTSEVPASRLAEIEAVAEVAPESAHRVPAGSAAVVTMSDRTRWSCC